MAKKASKSTAPSKTITPAVAAPVVTSTESRNSPIPRLTPARREITSEMIAKRAFEIHVGGTGGSQDDNWFRAERELKSL